MTGTRLPTRAAGGLLTREDAGRETAPGPIVTRFGRSPASPEPGSSTGFRRQTKPCIVQSILALSQSTQELQDVPSQRIGQ
ncbi:hypothetical protein SAMN05428945_5950 [Streptomyces sp. 2224.1]|nr:hypothetical protein BX261_6600 [Streptomyces sp. 2321.6]SDQ81909.1 hypothetical protein SAMN05216511_0649 [Streptomyces sp. KS_16]SED62170.1 hypothetical protein SAMN05428954_0634 [Streptomyces sp. 2112.3]SED89664.1 hypothetical protein SAMN05428945_5950 [Streptomyces sp. 2224.1]SEE00676.1 hypothetical protein SAMN05428940_6628 [Streptomyces sp. 2133.1]SNC73492.1 hypothetical protein SAMN06272741_6529 [Streptomyces sp. 2114.4]